MVATNLGSSSGGGGERSGSRCSSSSGNGVTSNGASRTDYMVDIQEHKAEEEDIDRATGRPTSQASMLSTTRMPPNAK